MEANITERRYSDDELTLAEPHFEEEATLLSAQPVVPLDEIREIRNGKPGAVSKKHLAFGLSILASLIIGLIGGTIVFRQRGQRSATEIVDSAIAGSDASTNGSSESAVSTGQVNTDLTSGTVPEIANAEAQPVAPVAQKKPRLVRNSPADTAQPEPEDVLSEADEREMRRAERIEERRLRRMEAREERYSSGRRRRGSDDLLRIRDIFEGSRRP